MSNTLSQLTPFPNKKIFGFENASLIKNDSLSHVTNEGVIVVDNKIQLVGPR